MGGGKVKKIVLLTAVCFCFLFFSVCAFATGDMREYFNSVGAKTNEIYDFDSVSREKAANFLDVFANAAGRENILKNGESVTVDESEYVSALLTVLGYSESDGDFLSCLPYDKALSLGFVKPSDLKNGVLTGEDVIEYSFRALAAKTKTGETLGEKAPFAGADYTELREKYPTVSLASLPLVSLSGEIASEDFSSSAVRDFKFDVKAVCDNTSHVIETYRTADKYEETLKIGSTLCGFSFAGVPVSVVVSVKTDTKTCEIYSEKSCEAVFEGGELKIKLSEPQVIKVVFDRTNAITIGAGTDADYTAEKALSDIPPSEHKSISAKNTVKNKIVVGKHLLYTENGTINVGGEVFVDESICASLGKSSEGLRKTEKYGVTYVSVKDLGGTVNSSVGKICFEISKDKITDLAFAAANGNSNVSFSSGAILVTALSDGKAGVMADISDITFDDSLAFGAYYGVNTSVPVEVAVAAAGADGTVRIVKHTVVCSDTKLPDTVYFDMTDTGEYDRLYLVVSFNGSDCGGVTVSGYALGAFTSPGYGDNEFDPFGN